MSEIGRIDSDGSIWHDLSVGVPVYSRPDELRQLLASVHELTVVPGEIVLSEDGSRERDMLKGIAAEWAPRLATRGCDLRFVENERNLGYDGNVRSLFRKCTRRWVMLLGNDDVVLPDAAASIRAFIERHPDIRMLSRSFVKFQRDPRMPQSVSRLSHTDKVFGRRDSDAGMLFRTTAFFGGLVVDRMWAAGMDTDAYDGTLYYQIYLAAHIFAGAGIGYVAEPIVGARTGNPPLFGSASSEKAVHIPGSYTPAGRASMWHGVLRICADAEAATGVPMLRAVRKELDDRQSFHIFEMMARQGRAATMQTASRFWSLGLMRRPTSWLLFLYTLALGRRSSWLFDATRKMLQR